MLTPKKCIGPTSGNLEIVILTSLHFFSDQLFINFRRPQKCLRTSFEKFDIGILWSAVFWSGVFLDRHFENSGVSKSMSFGDDFGDDVWNFLGSTFGEFRGL